MKLNKEDKAEVKYFHDLVVKGLVNGLTHTIWDGRRDDIEWVRGRLELWESFGRTLFNFLMETNGYKYELRDLKEISKKGYTPSNEEKKK